MAEINVQEATADPADLELVSPDVSAPDIAFIRRIFPDQSWSTIMSINFIMHHENDLRDNDILADIMATGILKAVERVNQDELDALYAASVIRRTETDLEPLDETTYKDQRDTNLLKGFISEVLVASGIEAEFAEDIVEALPDDRIVAIVDDAVEEQREAGTASSVEREAERIAIKLGLQYVPGNTDNKNLVVPEIYTTDSTDPYIKKVIK